MVVIRHYAPTAEGLVYLQKAVLPTLVTQIRCDGQCETSTVLAAK